MPGGQYYISYTKLILCFKDFKLGDKISDINVNLVDRCSLNFLLGYFGDAWWAVIYILHQIDLVFSTFYVGR